MARFSLLLFATLLTLLPYGPVVAQMPFTVAVNDSSTIRPVKFSAVAGGALFGDAGSRDDLFIVGELSNGLLQASIYRLVSRQADFAIMPPKVTSRFQEQIEIPLRDVSFGDVVIADMDGNGENDIVYTGRILFDTLPTGNVYGEFTGIYHNFTAASEEATFVLSDSETNGLPALSHSRLAVADFDGDGDMDIVLAGDRDAGEAADLHLGVYLNGFTTAGRFEPSQTWETAVAPTTLAAGDYDGDGDQDFVVGGALADGSPVVRLYANAGDGTFSEQVGALPSLHFSAAAFGDIDGDGDDDILLSGAEFGPSLMSGVTRLYEYESGSLTPRTDLDLAGLFYGHVEFADLEGDGDPDLFVQGISDPAVITGQRLVVYRNDSGSLTMISDARSAVFGGAAWVDYDGNGRQEIILTGERDDQRRVIIYEFL